jgi:N6-L-threonylcarbamoyladenine synthase
MMRVLGIESSCDETAAAVVEDGRRVRSSVVFSQIASHQPYGGVVPEVASRCHVERLPGIVRQAMGEAGVGWGDLDAIAVTQGPGLASALLVGVTAARALALRLDRPLIGVHHLAGHLYSVLLSTGEPDPWMARRGLALLVSGGHTSLVELSPGPHFRVLGVTLDDAAGEALDKGAKRMGLGYPGGPAIEREAEGGDAGRIAFPRGRATASPVIPGGMSPRHCFSFSGLKTALRYHLDRHPEDAAPGRRRDTAASYQEAVMDALAARLERAAADRRPDYLACAGGVACNRRLRVRLEALATRLDRPLLLAAPVYCTDNAAMIAAAAGAGWGRTQSAAAPMDIRPVFPLSA